MVYCLPLPIVNTIPFNCSFISVYILMFLLFFVTFIGGSPVLVRDSESSSYKFDKVFAAFFFSKI